MGSTDNSAIMTIDLKWNRFRIHKSTLNKMGIRNMFNFWSIQKKCSLLYLAQIGPRWWHLQPSEVGSNITPLFY